ncbi:hypothetical protein EJB05_49825, partial [Eragrostis curvula]
MGFIPPSPNPYSDVAAWLDGSVDPAALLLATCGGDTVKLFNVAVESGDPMCLPTPVNAIKWNNTSYRSIMRQTYEKKRVQLRNQDAKSSELRCARATFHVHFHQPLARIKKNDENLQ